MKTIRVTMLTAVLSVLAMLSSLAQPPMEDVIYLKNGSIYRGMIIEQVPNVSYKIKIQGGSVFVVSVSEVEKITKEEKPRPRYSDDDRYGMHSGFLPFHYDYDGHRDSTMREFKYRKRGRFINLQVLVENKQGGVRLVQGYKFNQHAALGVGIGADFVFSSPFNRRINDLPSTALSGVYVPLYLHLTGDMVPWKVTPFYAVEAGYFMAGLQRDRAWDDISHKKPDAHGPMASAGLGFKFNSSRGLNFSVLFNMNMKNVNYMEEVLRFDPQGSPYTQEEWRNATLLFPGVRFGFGFTAGNHKMRHMRKSE